MCRTCLVSGCFVGLVLLTSVLLTAASAISFENAVPVHQVPVPVPVPVPVVDARVHVHVHAVRAHPQDHPHDAHGAVKGPKGTEGSQQMTQSHFQMAHHTVLTTAAARKNGAGVEGVEGLDGFEGLDGASTSTAVIAARQDVIPRLFSTAVIAARQDVIPRLFVRDYFVPTTSLFDAGAGTLKVSILSDSTSANASQAESTAPFNCNSNCASATACWQANTGESFFYILYRKVTRCYGRAANQAAQWIDSPEQLQISAAYVLGGRAVTVLITCQPSVYGRGNFTLVGIR